MVHYSDSLGQVGPCCFQGSFIAQPEGSVTCSKHLEDFCCHPQLAVGVGGDGLGGGNVINALVDVASSRRCIL